MAGVMQKSEAGLLDGTPDKRLFWSIISDYDLKTGLCELIDNAVDLWQIAEKKRSLEIRIGLDANRQIISVEDNAGGVKHEELRLLITPGGSRNDPNSEIIGIFGVGSKRAAVALGEHIEIRTRYRRTQSYQIDITKDWLESPEWALPHYTIPDIDPYTTRIEITQLRKSFTEDDVERLIQELGEIYFWFLIGGVVIRLNGKEIKPQHFQHWAYPKKYSPREVSFLICLEDNGEVTAKITAGLIRDRQSEKKDNYGVYFYCNNRLIIKEVKNRHVGYFVTSEAGVPHPDASLCRVIVELTGPAKWMPWNSSKTDINYGHDVFRNLHPVLIQLTSYFSSLSRRLKADWEGQVFQHSVGEIESSSLGAIVEKKPSNFASPT